MTQMSPHSNIISHSNNKSRGRKKSRKHPEAVSPKTRPERMHTDERQNRNATMPRDNQKLMVDQNLVNCLISIVITGATNSFFLCGIVVIGSIRAFHARDFIINKSI